ncbi:hypothetical protein [Oceanisphaera arctica]|uniref:hypothetical protein n=1 Tax=Oceanisphaera arctica TaxID=641510 RepID=UPI0015E2CDF7|nr:hypothetical protein [Oceanisphaera arctica]GHA26429.1 hypothetical protein GCM10007082_28610 [Oceanisphaera arctica]
MKTPSIALFLALSAGYLGAASADTILNKPPQSGKETPEKTTATGADNASSVHDQD